MNNVPLVSGVEQSDSVMHIHLFFFASFLPAFSVHYWYDLGSKSRSFFHSDM